MTTVRRPAALCGIAFVLTALWTAFVWVTGIGAKLYVLPGLPLAEVLRPCEPLPQPSIPKSFGEVVAEAMVRCLPQSILAFELAVTFWLVLVPLAIFVVARLRQRSYA